MLKVNWPVYDTAERANFEDTTMMKFLVFAVLVVGRKKLLKTDHI